MSVWLCVGGGGVFSVCLCLGLAGLAVRYEAVECDVIPEVRER